MPPRDASKTSDDGLVLPSPRLRQAVAVVCDRDPTLQKIEAATGPLTVRAGAPGFPSLVRIIVGQQISSRAAQAIFQRLMAEANLTPAAIAIAPDITLQQVGLSRAKISTCQQLSAALVSNQLNLDTLATLPDADAVAQLTQIKGIGVWTAEVYLLFCLERLSSFPASDLAVQISYQRLKKLEHRPTRKALIASTEPLDPYRGAVAHLLWHYYRHLQE